MTGALGPNLSDTCGCVPWRGGRTGRALGADVRRRGRHVGRRFRRRGVSHAADAALCRAVPRRRGRVCRCEPLGGIRGRGIVGAPDRAARGLRAHDTTRVLASTASAPANPSRATTCGSTSARWPRFAPEALAAGYASVAVVPLRLRGQIIGAMNMLRDEIGAPEPADLLAAQALADVATIGLLQQRAARSTAARRATPVRGRQPGRGRTGEGSARGADRPRCRPRLCRPARVRERIRTSGCRRSRTRSLPGRCRPTW